MNQINQILRQHLFEILSPKYKCKIGSDHKDCSYIDYSEALEVRVNNDLLLIIFIANSWVSDRQPNSHGVSSHGIYVIWSGGPMQYKILTDEPIVPDISEPNFASFTNRITEIIGNFKMVVVHDDS